MISESQTIEMSHERERERERESARDLLTKRTNRINVPTCVYVCVCVCAFVRYREVREICKSS